MSTTTTKKRASSSKGTTAKPAKRHKNQQEDKKEETKKTVELVLASQDQFHLVAQYLDEAADDELAQLHMFWRALTRKTLYFIQLPHKNGERAGFASMQNEGQHAWISFLFIRKDERHQKYGTMAAQALLAKAKAAGNTSARLFARPEAWNFWSALGFRITNDRDGSVLKPEHQVEPQIGCYMMVSL